MPSHASPAMLALRSMLWLALFSLVARGAGFFKEMALAHRFGVGAVTDAYVLGFTWTVWMPGIFASVAMATLVPTLARLAVDSPSERDRFGSEFAGLSLVAGLVLAVATAAAPTIGGLGASLDPTLALTLPAMALIVPAYFLATYGSTRLVARHSHANLALEAVPAVVLIAVLVAPVDLDLRELCLATTAGYLLYALSVIVLMRRDGEPLALRFGFGSPGWRMLAGAASVMIIGNVCAGSLTLVDQAQAALLGEGSVSILGYASRLLMLPSVLMSMLITRAMLPVFSDLHAGGRSAELEGLVLRFATGAFVIGAAVALVVWVFAADLVAIAFERGSFVAEDTARTASTLRWGILQLPCFLASIVVIQALLGRQQFGAVAASGVFNLVAKLALNAWLAPVMGVDGIALATSIVLSLSLLILAAAFARSRGSLE
ncbi:MAG: lipid II flippase MurJ [Lautropia sp.]